MKTLSKTTAQQRADRIHAFNYELVALTREPVLSLSPGQQKAIDNYHHALFEKFRSGFAIDSTPQEKQLSLAMRIASFLGAVALAASVFFLFYQFWGRIGTGSQIGILSGASVLSFVATAIVAGKDPMGYFTKLVSLVAFACFVLNITMFGQIFNITPTDNALLAWAALALLLAYAYDVRLLLVAAVLCIIAFVSARVGAWSGMYWIHFGQRPENFFPIAIVLFFIPQWINHQRFSGFALCYRIFGIIIVTNAIALAGAAYNRSGEPDAVVELSERELRMHYYSGMNQENTGLGLRINCRLDDGQSDVYASTDCYGRPAVWLDQEKLIELDFDLKKRNEDTAGLLDGKNDLPHKVYLVLEYNGAAYRKALADEYRPRLLAANHRASAFCQVRTLQGAHKAG